MKRIGIALFVFLLFITLIPLMVLLFCSFLPLDSANDLLAGKRIPLVFSISQFMDLFADSFYSRMLLQSVKLTFFAVLFHLPVSFFAGLMIWQAGRRMKMIATAAYVVALLLPFQSTMLPVYQIFHALHLEDSLWSIIALAVFAPLGPLVMATWLEMLPEHCLDAALLETNSMVKINFYILLPQLLPPLIVLGFVTAAEAWNMTEQPLILLQQMNARPLSAVYNNTQRGGDSIAYAGSLLYLLPCLLMVIVLILIGKQKKVLLSCRE